MTDRILRDDAISAAPLADAVVAIVGYGNQGRAQALNLRDSGLRVRVGARPGRGRDRAVADGFAPLDLQEAGRGADLVMLLVPDEHVGRVFDEHVTGGLDPGTTIGLAHASAFVFGSLDVPAGHDAVVIAPVGPGVELRGRYVAGDGIPAVVGVYADAGGRALETALAYAKGIGCARAGVLVATATDEAVVDLFGEQAVLCGGLAALVTAGYETLVAAGHPPEMAYLECVQQIQLTAGLITRYGVDGMWDAISPTARYGSLRAGMDVVGAESRRAMERILEEIRSGRFWERVLADAKTGGAEAEQLRKRLRRDDMERHGASLRRLFGRPENR